MFVFQGCDPNFIDNAIRYVNSIPLNGMLLKLFPRPLRPLIAKFSTLGTRLFYSRCAHHLEPHFTARMPAISRDPKQIGNTFADWSVFAATIQDNPAEKTPDRLSRRIMALDFAAIHTSTMTTANLILDIASGLTSEACLTAILAECHALSSKHGDQWTSARLAEMVVVDSALRESMRLSGFGSRTFSRVVVAPAGVALPNGLHIPYGETLCTAGYPMHHDAALYDRPYDFCYDRFLQGERPEQSMGKTAATTEVTYAVWGHGKHACPGRFFAVALVKMLLACLVQRYEVKPWKERPDNVWVGDTPVPSREVLLEVRRRA